MPSLATKSVSGADDEARALHRLLVQPALEAERARKEQEMEALLQEAAALGVEDTTKLAEWVEARRQEFDAEKQRIDGLLAEALR